MKVAVVGEVHKGKEPHIKYMTSVLCKMWWFFFLIGVDLCGKELEPIGMLSNRFLRTHTVVLDLLLFTCLLESENGYIYIMDLNAQFWSMLITQICFLSVHLLYSKYTRPDPDAIPVYTSFPGQNVLS